MPDYQITPLEDEVVTNKGSYRCRKVIIACGLLHFPRRLAVLDKLQSKKIHYRIPKIGDYEDQQVVVVGGGDSALDAAVMVLERQGDVQLVVRNQVRGKHETLQRIIECGGSVDTSCQIEAAEFAGDQLRLRLSTGRQLACDLIIVQIGHLSVRETLQKLNLRLNDDGSVAVDQFFETSRPGIFAAGDVHGDIMLIPVAWAEGIQAAIYAFDEITRPYWLNEKRLRDQKIALIGEKMARAARKTQRARDIS